MTKFARGDRVIVVDLRTGLQHRGMVMRTVGGEKMDVAYDDGEAVRVGESFVRHDPNPPTKEQP